MLAASSCWRHTHYSLFPPFHADAFAKKPGSRQDQSFCLYMKVENSRQPGDLACDEGRGCFKMPLHAFIPSFPASPACACSLRLSAHAPWHEPEARDQGCVSMPGSHAPGLSPFRCGRHVSCSQQRTWGIWAWKLLSAMPLLLSCLCAKGSFYSQHLGSSSPTRNETRALCSGRSEL